MPLIAYILIAALAALSTGPVLAAIVVNIVRSRTTEWTSWHIAYILLREVIKAEGRVMPSDRKGEGKAVDRKWLLDAYAECIQAVENPDKRLSQTKL